jgi:hypothetical protein
MKYKYVVEKFKKVYYYRSAWGEIDSNLVSEGTEIIFETGNSPSRTLSENETICIGDKEYKISRILYDPKEDVRIVFLDRNESVDDVESIHKAYGSMRASSKKYYEDKYDELSDKFSDYKETYTRKGWFK